MASASPSSARAKKETLCSGGIVGLAFNRSGTRAVFSPNNSLLFVVDCTASSVDSTVWTVLQVLEEHTETVSCARWHPTNDSTFLSCSHDRSAFVWVKEAAPAPLSSSEASTARTTTTTTATTATAASCTPQKERWLPQLIMLDSSMKRGLTCCGWSASGAKVYIGSAAANVAVGRFEPAERWWVCRVTEPHRSTITCVAPHPHDSTLLATGALDSQLALVSTLMKKVDGKAVEAAAFGHVYHRQTFRAWVHAVAWSPSGEQLAVATHDSCVHVLNVPRFTEASAGKVLRGLSLSTVRLRTLPLLSVTFLSETRLVGGGFDYYPMLFEKCEKQTAHPSVALLSSSSSSTSSSSSSFTGVGTGAGGKVGDGEGSGGSWRWGGKWLHHAGAGKQSPSGTAGLTAVQRLAREKFQSDVQHVDPGSGISSGGGGSASDGNTVTAHQGTINSVISLPTAARVTMGGTEGTVPCFVSAGLDGRVELWSMADVQRV